MPKIPTFTAQARPTAEVGSTKINLKLSPTATPAASLLPAAEAIDKYYIKQRDLKEKTQANKSFFEIKNEVDIIQAELKNDFDEENSVNTFQQKYNLLTGNTLNLIKNKRVKNLLQTKLDIEYPDFVNTIKKNSRNALEVEFLANHNTQQQILMGEYLLAKLLKTNLLKMN